MITLSDAAAARMKEYIKEKDYKAIRPAVEGGGCSGFRYKLTFENSPRSDDKILNSKGVSLYVDTKSFLYLMGMEIDYVDNLNESGFKFNNPNARRTCGCGESFSL